MKLIYLIIIFIFLIPTSSLALEEQKIDIDLKIISYQILDSYVVGDAFYYQINLTNRGGGYINDTPLISVFNPANEQVNSPQFYEIILAPNESISITAKGGKDNETALFPFDSEGVYKIEITATGPIDFYRWWTIKEGKEIIKKYIRQHKTLSYAFDVMSKQEYNIQKTNRETSQRSSEINEKILSLTGGMSIATWVMVGIATFTLFITVLSLIIAGITGLFTYKNYQETKPKICTKEGILRAQKEIEKRMTKNEF